MATIDNPPAQPDTSPYQISALAIYPVVTAQPVGETADPTQPGKTWTRPVQPGENPASYKLFDTYAESPTGSWAFSPQSLALTLAQAAAVNVPAGLTEPSSNPPASATVIWDTSIPAPSRGLLANEVIQPQLMGAPLVVRTDIASAGSAAVDPVEERELTGLNQILSYLKLPPV